jgi:hypothetical protein
METNKIRWRMKSGTHRAVRRIEKDPQTGGKVNLGWEKVGEKVKEGGKLARFILFGRGDVALVPDSEVLDSPRWERLDPIPTISELQARERQPPVKLEVKARAGKGGWYDVVNPQTGKQLNDKALHLTEALDMAGVTLSEADETADA